MSKDAPKSPDPEELIRAQARANRLDQFGPFGSLIFSGPDRSTATVELSPEQQRILEQRQQAQQLAGQFGVNLFEGMEGAGTGNRERVEQASFDRAMSLLNPELERQERALRQRLANQGLPQASRAFTSEVGRFQRGRNEAAERAAMAAVLQGDQAASAELNRALAALGLAQVESPEFFAPGQVDVLGPYNQRLAAEQAQQQLRQQLLGGLMGLGGQLGAATILA